MSITEFEFESNSFLRPEPPRSSTPTTTTDHRAVLRTLAELKTIVQVETAEGSWKEVTQVTSISRNGAGFTLTRDCQVGRLVKLVMPMPADMRAYDVNAELYPIVGVIQYCREVVIDNEKQYQVGVGFIGKSLPESYKNDPDQSYSIVGMTDNGLWKVTESGSPFRPRKNSRFWMSIPMTVSLMKGKGKEDAMTQNISATGAALPTTLPAHKGDRVKVASEDYKFYAIAVVRDRKDPAEGDDKQPTLHLEFLETEFPMEKVVFENDTDRSPEVTVED